MDHFVTCCKQVYTDKLQLNEFTKLTGVLTRVLCFDCYAFINLMKIA